MRLKLILKNTPPEWNVRVLTMDDFYTYCDEAEIIVHEIQLESMGCRIERGGRSQLFINQALRGENKLFVCFHELAHCWLHPPGIQFFHGWKKSIEFEANAVATCALIPKSLLVHYLPSEIAEEYGYSMERIKFRRALLDFWQL